MAEYIDREALLRITEQQGHVSVDDILNEPAADVAPVVHGRWVHHDDGVVTCSECGNAESSESYYCRYCGAKMDGDSTRKGGFFTMSYDVSFKAKLDGADQWVPVGDD